MYHPYLFEILIREREREILEEVRRGGYHARGHRRGSNLSKKIARRLRLALIKLKTTAVPRQIRQKATHVKGASL